MESEELTDVVFRGLRAFFEGARLAVDLARKPEPQPSVDGPSVATGVVIAGAGAVVVLGARAVYNRVQVRRARQQEQRLSAASDDEAASGEPGTRTFRISPRWGRKRANVDQGTGQEDEGVEPLIADAGPDPQPPEPSSHAERALHPPTMPP